MRVFHLRKIGLHHGNGREGDYDDSFSRICRLQVGRGLLLAGGVEVEVGQLGLSRYSVYRRGKSGHTVVEGVFLERAGDNVTRNQV